MNDEGGLRASVQEDKELGFCKQQTANSRQQTVNSCLFVRYLKNKQIRFGSKIKGLGVFLRGRMVIKAAEKQ